MKQIAILRPSEGMKVHYAPRPGSEILNQLDPAFRALTKVLAQRPTQYGGLGKPLHQREKAELRGWPELPKRKQEESRVGAVFWIETMLAEQRGDLPGDTTIPASATRWAGTAFAPEPLYRSP
jgi:hypothetical protein